METTITIAHGAAQDMTGVPTGSVDLIVTSPPYPMVAMWDTIFAEQDPRIGDRLHEARGQEAFELMHVLLDAAWLECDRVLKTGGLACINIGDATRTLAGDFQLYSNHSRILRSFLDRGYAALPDILWRKQTNAPNKFMGSGMLPVGAYVTYEHEYILVLRKGPRRRFTTTAEQQLRRESAFFWEERNVWFSDVWQDIKGVAQTSVDALPDSEGAGAPSDSGGSVQAGAAVPHESGDADHASADTPLGSGGPEQATVDAPPGSRDAAPANRGARRASSGTAARERSGAFPFELAYRLVCMFSIRGDVVLDPFAGTGTTLAAALACGRNAVGVDLEPSFPAAARRLLAAAPAHANEHNRDRLARHRAFATRRAAEGAPLKHVNVHYGFPVMTTQERELLLPKVTRVTVAGEGVVRVAYEETPQLRLAGL